MNKLKKAANGFVFTYKKHSFKKEVELTIMNL